MVGAEARYVSTLFSSFSDLPFLFFSFFLQRGSCYTRKYLIFQVTGGYVLEGTLKHKQSSLGNEIFSAYLWTLLLATSLLDRPAT